MGQKARSEHEEGKVIVWMDPRITEQTEPDISYMGDQWSTESRNPLTSRTYLDSE